MHKELWRLLGNDRLPWREELARLVGQFNRGHAVKDKDVAHKTREDRKEFYFAFFTELRDNADVPMRVRPHSLGNRHVAFMVRRWVARGLEPGTIQLYLSYLRTFAGWIGHPGMVLTAEKYVDDPAKVERSYAAAADKSWSAHGIVPDAKIAEVAAFDRYVGCQLLMALRFNLRVKEAIMCPPHTAELHGQLEVRHGTKGGRPRFVPIDTPEKRAALETAKRCVESKSAHLGRPGKTLEQNLERFRYVMRKFGITKAMLGVTAHGLRHEYANDRYAQFAGVASPVRGGPAIEREEDRAARLRLAEELGHARENISTAYIGPVLRRPRAIAAKSAAEGCPSAAVSGDTSDDPGKE